MKIKEFEVFQTCDIEIIQQVKRISEYLAVYIAKDIKSNEIIPITIWDNNSALTPGKYLLVPSSTGKSASVVNLYDNIETNLDEESDSDERD